MGFLYPFFKVSRGLVIGLFFVQKYLKPIDENSRYLKLFQRLGGWCEPRSGKY